MARKKKAKKRPSRKKGPWLAWNVLAFPFRAAWWLVRKLASLFAFSRQKAEELSIKRHRTELGKASSYAPFGVVETIEGDWNAFENKLFSNKSTIGIILGARGSGKTGLGMRLLENAYAKTARRCYCMGFQQETLPSWLTTISAVGQARKDSFILIDEGGILFSSRQSMSEANKILSEALLVARHNDLSIMFISQNSANLEINALRQTDYLLLKPSSLLQKDFERQKIKDIYEAASSGFQKHKGVRGLTYVYSTEFRGFVSNGLPSFWTSRVSKAFRK